MFHNCCAKYQDPPIHPMDPIELELQAVFPVVAWMTLLSKLDGGLLSEGQNVSCTYEDFVQQPGSMQGRGRRTLSPAPGT